MFGCFLFTLDVNTIYGIHIQLIMPNTIENESKKPRADKQNGYREDNVKRENEI